MKKDITSKIIHLLILASLLLALQPGLAAAADTPPIYLPLVQGTGSGTNTEPLPLPAPDESTSKSSLPAGFEIRIFASGLDYRPRLMEFGPDGHLYLPLMGSGKVIRLPDRNNDGKADGVELIASGFTGPHNVTWHDGWLYVAEIGKIERLRDQNNDGTFETRQLVTDNIPGSGGHTSRTVHFGPDGKMYVSAGSTGNNTPETDPRRAAILRFNPDGSIPADNPFANNADLRKRPLWAWGLRNSVDFLWSASGTLWADHNGSDHMGDDKPPEEIIIPVQANKSHGWPDCYTPVLGLNQPTKPEVPAFDPPTPGVNCSQAVPALLTVEAHSAPLGMATARGTNFPPEYQDDVFVALHGSWNVNNPASYRDCKIQRVLIQNGQVVGSETFLNGWRPAGATCGDSATYGRPAGIAFGPDGAMYISDDKSNRIYRVIYQP